MNEFVFISEKKADDLRPNTAYPGDVIFTQRGTLGQVGIVPPESKFPRYIISQSQMKLSVDPKWADPRYVYYFFRLPSTVKAVINRALTSGVPHINLGSEDRLVQQTFAEHLQDVLGWESDYAHNAETFGPHGTPGRLSDREVVLVRDLRKALERLNLGLPASAREQAIEKLTRIDFARSLLQHNREFYGFIRGGVPVEWRDAAGETRHAHAQVIDFRNPANNRFLAVRELKIQGVRVPHYNRRADLVCFVNGLPLVFIELKAVYRNIRAGFDENLTDYLNEHSIAHDPSWKK